VLELGVDVVLVGGRVVVEVLSVVMGGVVLEVELDVVIGTELEEVVITAEEVVITVEDVEDVVEEGAAVRTTYAPMPAAATIMITTIAITAGAIPLCFCKTKEEEQ
jgi:hypothetical protein